jgi:hypothetical protein
MMFDFNPETCELVEKQLIQEGAVDRIVEAAKKEADGQFGNELPDGFGGCMLCLRAGCVIFCDAAMTAAKQAGRKGVNPLAWISALQMLPHMMRSVLSSEIKKRENIK